VIYIPVRTRSEANLREHWAKRAKRAKAQRTIARIVTSAWVLKLCGWISVPVVTLVRVAPRKLDSDNLAGSLKAIRDGVADALGISDGSLSVEWVYRQRVGEPREYAVEVEIK
jgi:hypothetical protein